MTTTVRSLQLVCALAATLLLGACITSQLPSRAADPYYYNIAAAGLKTKAEVITAMEKGLTRLSNPEKWQVVLTEEGAVIQVQREVYSIGWCDMDPGVPIEVMDLLLKKEYIVKLADMENPPFFQFNREGDARTLHSLVLKMQYLSGCPGALPPQHTLTITSTPPGAAFFVDDVQKGVTPLTFQSAEAWGVRVRLEMEGFQPLEQVMDVKADGAYQFALEKMEVDLAPAENNALALPAPPAAGAPLPATGSKLKSKAAKPGARDTLQKKKEFLKALYLKNAISSEQFERAIRSLAAGKPDRLVEELVAGKLSVETFREVY